MTSLREIYHALIPLRVRSRLGMLRRGLADSVVRKNHSGLPFPSGEALSELYGTPFLSDSLAATERIVSAAVALIPASRRNGPRSLLVVGEGIGLFPPIIAKLEMFDVSGCELRPVNRAWIRGDGVQVVDFPALASLPYEDEHFDIVLAPTASRVFGAARDALTLELARVSRPGGIIIMTAAGGARTLPWLGAIYDGKMFLHTWREEGGQPFGDLVLFVKENPSPRPPGSSLRG